MEGRWSRVLRLLCATGAVATFLPACEGPSSPAASSIREPAPEPVVEVQTARLRRGVLSQALSAPGSVVARRRSLIGVEVTGRILRVHVSVGERVTAGAPLFEIDPTTYAMALRQAEAGLDVAEAERRQMESDVKRANTLRRQNVLAQQEIERLSTALAVAQARVRQATEAVALAQQNLQKTLVRAPYAGSIVERLADEGTTALVQPQTVVLVLEETAELEARASIAESQMALVSVGDPATVRIEGLADPVDTTVAAVADSIDPATRTYLVKMPVPNPEFRIKAGVFAHVEIRPNGTPELLLAPREAIRVEDGRSRLLVVHDGHVETRIIEVGVVSDKEAEILRGADGSEVVVIGDAAHTLVGGMRVQLASNKNQPP